MKKILLILILALQCTLVYGAMGNDDKLYKWNDTTQAQEYPSFSEFSGMQRISSGTVIKPTITYNVGAGTVTVGEGTYRFFSNSDYTGTLSEHTVAGTDLAVGDGVTTYIIAQYNSGTPQLAAITDVSSVDDATNCIIYTVARMGDEASFIDWDEPALGLANKLHRRLVETQRFAHAYGFDLGEEATRTVTIAAGKVWEGSFPNILDTVSSAVDDVQLMTNNGDGTFSFADATQYPNTLYDDKSGSHQTLTDGNYGIIWVYRCMGVGCKKAFLVLGNGDYDFNTADTSQPPEVPAMFSTNAMLVGRIIVLKGASTATQIDSAFDSTFAASTTTDHGGLTGLTGGHDGVYDHLPVHSADGLTEILGVNKTTERVRVKNIDSPISNYLGNGILSGFTISINADNTKIDISAGVGNSVVNTDHTTPVWTTVEYPGTTALALTNIASANATYLAINAEGTVVQQTTPYTATQRGSGLILIGAAIHSNRVNVNVVNNLPDVALDGTGQFNELLDGLRNFNVSGNVFSANGANFNINKSDGIIFKRGCNFETDPQNPHAKPLAALTAPANLRYRLQDGTEYGDTSLIDYAFYDNGGVRTALPTKKYTVQRITLFSSNIVRIQYGQTIYDTAAEAIQGISIDPFVVESNIGENGLLRCLLVVKSNATALNDTSQAQFLSVDKFGGTEATGAGSATTTLQQAYENSAQPQTTTDATSGAVQIKRGSAADTDNVFEILNGSDNKTSSITGDGDITARSFGSKFMKVSDGLFETAVAGIEYYGPDQHGGLFGTIYRKYIAAPDNPASGGLLTIPLGVTPTALLNIGGWVLEHTTNKLIPIPNGSGATTDPRGIFAATDGSNLVLDANDNLDWDSGYVWIDYTK